MFKKKNKNKTKILIISSIVVLILLVVGGIFWWKRKDLTKKSSSNNNLSSQEKPLPPNNLQDKEDSNNKESLASKIKTDLKEKINRVKSSKARPDSKDWVSYVVFADKISCIEPGGTAFLKQRESIFPSQVGTENYNEIVSLINQAKQARKEWIIKKNQEAEQKLTNQPDLFYNAYEQDFCGKPGDWPNWGFTGKQEGQKFSLIIPKNHPVFTNFSISESGDFNYYLITGTKNISLVPLPTEGIGLYKIVKPENQITIKLIEN